ncbi:MAG: hypothetical protein K8I02_13115 [Candidatus Methylomirabilis sp.]|nr:hypothetical protein [Deltaproteobacteria bacterium]
MNRGVVTVCATAALACAASAFAAETDDVAKQNAKEIKQLKQRFETLQQQVKESSGGSNFGVSWKEGLYFETKDKQFKANVGGRALLDWAYYEGDRDIEKTLGKDIENFKAGFRAVRLEVGGTAYNVMEYKVQIDFVEKSTDRTVSFTDRGVDLNADGDFTDPGEYGPVTTSRTVTDSGRIQFKDVYLGFTGLQPFGGDHAFGARIGHFKEPFSMEELGSSRFTTFLERGLNNVFAPGRNVGAQLSSVHFEDRLSFAVGGFLETDDDGSITTDGGKWNLSARVASQPIWCDYDEFVHLGFSYSRRNPTGDSARIRQRPESSFAERFVDTKALAATGVDLFNPEIAVVYGPFSAQGEFTYADIDRRRARNVQTEGMYAQASYFLTGESRGYSYKNGTFGRIVPNANFVGPNDFLGGPGAWEVAGRFSHLNLNDGAAVQGGEVNDFTAALNWYPNPNMRVMFNYIYANLVRSGEENIAQMRFQVDF